jgi:hypothetical protein
MERNEVNRLLSVLAVLMTGYPLAPLQSHVATGAELQDIRNSVTCLAHDRMQMLGRLVPSKVVLISARDEHHLWLFVERANRVYDVFDVEIVRQPRQVYSLVNSATIRWDGRRVHEIGAPLGGVWTHEVMAKNFHAALMSKPMRMRAYAPVHRQVRCRSYASPRDFH